MYHTTTPTIVGGAVAAPVVGSVVEGATRPESADATVAAGSAVAPEFAEVLGVKFTRGDNPLVDAVHGAVTGTLPFTGVNVLFLTLSAITVVLMGLALVRIARNLTSEA